MKKTATPIRVGIVGLGRAGFGMQTQELLARPGMYEIVAGCDLSPKQRRRFGDKVPGAKLPARRATTGLMDSFGRGETLPWIEETREVRKDLRPDCIWDALHGHLRGGKPFRVTTEEAFEVMRVLALASKAPVL